jgi:SNF2 family DNA or RNA helicase
MHAYQTKAVEFIKEKKRCAMFIFMGGGKTTTTLTAISDLQDQMNVHKVLVIAPLRVANSVWHSEASNWRHLAHLKVQICTGTEKDRLTALHRTADVYTINRENIPWLVKLYGKKWPFDMVVIDESSSFKSAASQRFKALKKILPFTNYMVLLTGTPSPNGLLDLWSQMYLLDQGVAIGRTMTAYKQRFFEADYMGYKYTPRPGADTLIHNAIQGMVLSMKGEDYLELPERIDLTEYVDLPPKVKKQYDEFERDLLLEFESGEVVEAVSAAVLANKLNQLANGASYVDSHKNWIESHVVKLDALADIIEQNEGENILVAYNFKTDLERLQKRFPQAQQLDKDSNTIVRWNAGEIPLLLAHPQSAGHGINCQQGGAIAVWFGLNWSLELYQQFNARLHRQGQTRPVRIIHIVARDTIDERLITALAAKDVTQSKLLNALKNKDFAK